MNKARQHSKHCCIKSLWNTQPHKY